MIPAIKAKFNISSLTPGSRFPAGCYAACFFILFFAASCNSVPKPKDSDPGGYSKEFINLPAPGPVPDSEFTSIKKACEHWYDSVLKPGNFNGGILVAKKGNIIFERYSGTGHLPGIDTITENTALHIASVSKTFTAMAVLKLVQDGKLHLDDEFNKYFPAFNYPGVTIRDLLSHRSGLPNYLYFMEELGWDKSVYIKNQDVLDYLINRKAELTDITTPGTHFTYCNTNYALLALLIEKVTAVTYPQFISQTFFIPLQMKNSFVFSLADTARAKPSYDWKGRIQQLNFLDQVYGDKNIYTTPRDLLIWDRALTSNLLFTKETLEQAYTPYSNEKPGIRNYGLGWRMNIYPTGKKVIYHNGWWHGSNASFKRLLHDSATIILICNKFNRFVYHTEVLASFIGGYYNPGDEEETESLKTNDAVQNNSIPKLKNKKRQKQVTLHKKKRQKK